MLIIVRLRVVAVTRTAFVVKKVRARCVIFQGVSSTKSSPTSFGSIHILRAPQFKMEAASRFCSFKDTIAVFSSSAVRSWRRVVRAASSCFRVF